MVSCHDSPYHTMVRHIIQMRTCTCAPTHAHACVRLRRRRCSIIAHEGYTILCYTVLYCTVMYYTIIDYTILAPHPRSWSPPTSPSPTSSSRARSRPRSWRPVFFFLVVLYVSFVFSYVLYFLYLALCDLSLARSMRRAAAEVRTL